MARLQHREFHRLRRLLRCPSPLLQNKQDVRQAYKRHLWSLLRSRKIRVYDLARFEVELFEHWKIEYPVLVNAVSWARSHYPFQTGSDQSQASGRTTKTVSPAPTDNSGWFVPSPMYSRFQRRSDGDGVLRVRKRPH